MSRPTTIFSNNGESFICAVCSRAVLPLESGGRNRNHCPHCLASLHLDLRPGDRRSSCRGVMKPVGIWVQANREWSLLHRCERCGFIRANRVAADDSELALLGLAVQPLGNLPFPVGSLVPGGVPGGAGNSGSSGAYIAGGAGTHLADADSTSEGAHSAGAGSHSASAGTPAASLLQGRGGRHE